MTIADFDFERRWANGADRSGGDSACWPWLGKATNFGYGRIRYQGRLWYAHRLAFYLRHGTKPEAVCHRCDNPPCVNPAHLREGTLADNTAEMWAKGRARAMYSTAKVGPRERAIIAARYTGGIAATEALAVELGISRRTIYRYVAGYTQWSERRAAA